MSQSIEFYEKELEQEFGSGSQREMYLLAIIRALKSEAEVRVLAASVNDLRKPLEDIVNHYFHWAEINEPDLTGDLDAAISSLMNAGLEAVRVTQPHQRAADTVEIGAKAVSEFIRWATVNVDPEFAEWQDFADKYAAQLRAKAGAV